MRTSTIRAALSRWALPAAALLAAANLALAQQPPATESKSPQPPPAKQKEPAQKEHEPSLEEMLIQALKDNPDIRVAEAKRQEADAELNRIKLQVMQKVIALHADLERARAKVAYAESQFTRFQQLHEQKSIDRALLDEKEDALAAAKAELASLEAQVPALLGKPPERAGQVVGQAVEEFRKRAAQTDNQPFSASGYRKQEMAGYEVYSPVAEKVRKAMDEPVAVSFKDAPLADVLEELQSKAGIVIRDQLTRYYKKEAGPKITLTLQKALPLRAVLQILEDELDPEIGIVFVVRDYGLLLTTRATLPEGAVLLDRLPSAGTEESSAAAKNPPAADVEGRVNAVDAKTGLVTVSVGSDDGVAKGNTLEVYRLNPAKYLGTVRVIETKPHEAVAQPVNRPLAPIHQGDKVASKILGS